MDVTYKILETALKKELELYKQYLETCYNIRDYVKESDIEKIQACIKKQELVAGNIGELEGSRQLLINEFAEQNNVSKEKINLSFIIQSAEQNIRKKLVELQYKLKSILKEVQKENKINSVLMSESLNYIKNSFEIIAGVCRKKEVYNAGGRATERLSVARNILNRTA